MKTLTINVIKRNRLYYAAEQNGYKCKIKIDDERAKLELGENTLLLKDISVKSKYGIDRIYALCGLVKNSEIVSLRHDLYNQNLVDECRNLGGRWDAEEKAWIFSDIVEDKVNELDELFNSEKVVVEITANDDCWQPCRAVTFLGYTIAKAFGRDSGAKLGEEVSLISGKISSGGSMKNWQTKIEEGSIFRLKVARELLDACQGEDDFSFKILGE